MDERASRDMSLFVDAPRREDLVVVMPHHEDVALAAATAVAAEARQAVRNRGRFSLALSGGSTPRRTYELLAQASLLDDVPWSSTHIFWGDERCVGPDDPRSNERMAREALLDHVPVPPWQVHPIRCGLQSGLEVSGEPDAEQRARGAAESYDRLLREQDATMDLVLLGLGEDGHTASLFPGSDALYEDERLAFPVLQENAGRTSGSVDGRLWRVTMTASFINQAAAVFFIVTGAAKAEVLRALISGEVESDSSLEPLPARFIRPSDGRLCWFLDEEAASRLDEGGLS